MKLRVINSVLLVMLITLGGIFGFQTYKNNLSNLEADSSFDRQLNANINDIRKGIANGIQITNNNKNSNNKYYHSNSPSNSGANDQEVSFSTFQELFSYSLNKYLKAPSVYTTGSGTVTIVNAKVDPPLNMTIVNRPLAINYVKAKQGKQKFFQLSLKGEVADNLNAAFVTTHYTDGGSYKYQMPNDPVVNVTELAYLSTFKWDMNQLFHLSTQEIVSAIKDSEIVAHFSEASGDYTTILKINTSSFNSNFSSILAGVVNAPTLPKFNSIEMTIKIDKYGNLKTIKYEDEIETKIKYNSISMQGRITTSFTESFVSVGTNPVIIKSPF